MPPNNCLDTFPRSLNTCQHGCTAATFRVSREPSEAPKPTQCPDKVPPPMVMSAANCGGMLGHAHAAMATGACGGWCECRQQPTADHRTPLGPVCKPLTPICTFFPPFFEFLQYRG
eukprot:gene20919-biopygen2618